ncbi:MAG TPA: DUF456 domain-containing protein [Methylophilaceae bacterium]|nr:DUF456 domain-containing protein [Methylophilaceae bacterium]
MEWLWIVVALLVLVGLAGILLPMLPGIPLLFGGLLLGAWIDHFTRVGGYALTAMGVIAVLAWLVDLVASLVTTKSAGASRQALIGTVIGGLIGVVGGLVGIILGTVIGAVLGEIMASRDARRATQVGIAAGMGFVLAMVAKLVLALLMLGIFAYAYFY